MYIIEAVLSQFKDNATLLSKNLNITALKTLISMITAYLICFLSLCKTLLHRLHLICYPKC